MIKHRVWENKWKESKKRGDKWTRKSCPTLCPCFQFPNNYTEGSLCSCLPWCCLPPPYVPTVFHWCWTHRSDPCHNKWHSDPQWRTEPNVVAHSRLDPPESSTESPFIEWIRHGPSVVRHIQTHEGQIKQNYIVLLHWLVHVLFHDVKWSVDSNIFHIYSASDIFIILGQKTSYPGHHV